MLPTIVFMFSLLFSIITISELMYFHRDKKTVGGVYGLTIYVSITVLGWATLYYLSH